MPQPWIESRLILLALIGLGGCSLGLLAVILYSSRRPRKVYVGLLATLISGLGIFSAYAAWCRQPTLVWAAPLLLIGAFFALWLVLTHPIIDRGLAYLPIIKPRLIRSFVWALFMVGSLALGLRESISEADDDPDGLEAVSLLERTYATAQPPTLEAIAPSIARTDKGREIKLYKHANPETLPDDAEIMKRQKKLLASMALSEHVIALGLSTQGTNCFGVVFAGGRYWLKGEDVPAILQDNNYYKVRRPLPNDVAIYYRADGSVEHAGTVRFSEPKGLIIVSSKWGRFGRFLHRHDLTLYTDVNCTFYRSERKGHALTGINYTPASTPEPGNQETGIR